MTNTVTVLIYAGFIMMISVLSIIAIYNTKKNKKKIQEFVEKTPDHPVEFPVEETLETSIEEHTEDNRSKGEIIEAEILERVPMLPDETADSYLKRLPAADVRSIAKQYVKERNIAIAHVEYEDPGLTLEQVRGKVFANDWKDNITMTMIGKESLPIPVILPRQLAFVIAREFGIVDRDGDIDMSNPILLSDYNNFLKDNDIHIGYTHVAAQNLKMVQEEYEQIIIIPGSNPKNKDSVTLDEFVKNSGNPTALSQILEMDSEVMIQKMKDNFVNAVSQTKNNILALKYEDEGQLYVKYTKSEEVWKNFIDAETKIQAEKGRIMNGQEFIDWYSDATDTIMMLTDAEHEETEWTLVK